MVTLILPPEKESELRSSLEHEDRIRAKEILVEAIDPTLDVLLTKDHPPKDLEAIIAEMDRIMDQAFEGRERPQLPAEAITRAGIYGEHP